MNTTIERTPDGSISMTLTIAWDKIQSMFDDVMTEFVKNAEVKGFRQGKAPKALVEKNIEKSKVYEEVIRRIIPKVYQDAIVEQKLRPIVTPKIELQRAEENKDWILKATTCEKPAVELGNYKAKIMDLIQSKHKKIWLPGEVKDEKKQESAKATLDEILTVVFNSVSIKIPSILLQNEVNRLLSDLIDQTKKLGLTVEQYLTSTNRTSESVRREYEEQAKRTIALELSLEAIADKENITVSDEDIDNAIKGIKTENEKKILEKERYYLASILRRQKTVDFLAAL